MTPAHPTLTSLVIVAYWDLSRVLRALWRPALIAFVILLVSVFAAAIIPILLTYSVIGQVLLAQAVGVGGAILLAPYFIAVLRFVLLEETPRGYAIEVDSSRFQLFFGWLVVLVLIGSLPSFVTAATTPAAPFYHFGGPPSAGLSQLLIVEAIRMGIVLIILRLIILLPAIAVDAPGAIWQNALGDTRQCGWFTVGASVASSLPVLLLGVAAVPIMKVLPDGVVTLLVGYVIGMGVFFVALTLVLVVAARLFQAFGDRLNRPL